MKVRPAIALLMVHVTTVLLSGCVSNDRLDRTTPRQTLVQINRSVSEGDLGGFLACVDYAPEERESLVCLYELATAIRTLRDAVDNRFGDGAYAKLYDKGREHQSVLARFDVDKAVIKTVDNLAFCYQPGGRELRLYRKNGVWRVDSLTMLGAGDSDPYSAQTIAASRIMAGAMLRAAAEAEEPEATFVGVKEAFANEMMNVLCEVFGTMNKKPDDPSAPNE